MTKNEKQDEESRQPKSELKPEPENSQRVSEEVKTLKHAKNELTGVDSMDVVQQESMTTQPGAIAVGGTAGVEDLLEEEEDKEGLSSQNEATRTTLISDIEVVAHLAPNESHLEVAIENRLRNEIAQRAEALVLDSLQQLPRLAIPTTTIDDNEDNDDHGLIVVTTTMDAKEESDFGWKKTNKYSMIVKFVVLLLLVVGGGGSLLYWLYAGDDDSKSRGGGSTVSPTSDVELFNSLLEFLRPFLVEKDEDRLVFSDPSSPQSQALAWLQYDPIIWEPGTPIVKILERYALVVLYFSTSGPSWTNSKSYMLQWEPVCEWNKGKNSTSFPGMFGIHCSIATGLVDSICLRDNNLKGTIPWKELGLLPSLFSLDFSENYLTGSLLEIRELVRLKRLWLQKNRFTGPLPEEFPATLEQFNVNENVMTGSIPSSWSSNTTQNLRTISLYMNKITGTLSSGFAQLSDLQILDIADNLMTGSIPTELGQVKSLTEVWISGNSFIGDLEDIFCHRNDWDRLVNDCGMSCSCCTMCCPLKSGSCRWPA